MSIVWIDRMAVDVRGEGDAVVFVHGLGGSLNVFTPLLPALARWRCVRPELPGAARSSRAYALAESAPRRGRLSTAVHAEAVQRVCEVLGVARAHFVGHSWGTLVCQQLAAEAPQRVRSLTLFGALLEPAPAMRDNLRARAAKAREQGLFEVAEATAEAALSVHTRQTQPVAAAYVCDTIASHDAEGYARNCEALAEAEAAPHERIGCPVLIVGGDEDPVTPLSGARQLAARLRDARVEVLPRCGHWPTLERPADCQRLLRDFLDRQR